MYITGCDFIVLVIVIIMLECIVNSRKFRNFLILCIRFSHKSKFLTLYSNVFGRWFKDIKKINILLCTHRLTESQFRKRVSLTFGNPATFN